MSTDRTFLTFFAPPPPPLRWFISRILSLATTVVSVSTANAEQLKACFPEILVSTVPNSYEVLPEVHTPTLPSHTVLFAGRIDPEKGLLDLLQAFGTVRRIIPDVRLLIAGDGSQADDARRTADQLEISSAVEFKGWLTGAELADCFARATVFCLPSYCDAMPMALLLAMAAKVPVIATPIGGIPELIEPEISGLLVSPGDTAALADSLVRLLTNAELRDRLSASAFERVELNSPTHIDKLLDGLYRSVLD